MNKCFTDESFLQCSNSTQPFSLNADATNDLLGDILSQGLVGKDKPIAYASRTVKNSEGIYSFIEEEMSRTIL